MDKQLTKAQVQDLFAQEAVLIGTNDGVPFQRVTQLFGSNAANYGLSLEGGGNTFGIGDYQLSYLTIKGFCGAAAYHNVELIHNDLEEVQSA